jgi:hypothetical protein
MEKMPSLWDTAGAIIHNFMDSDKSPKSPESATKLREFQEERWDIFGEAFESILAHQFPTISKWMDVLSTIWVTEKDKEEYAFQNEFEALSALTILIPDSFLKKFTDKILAVPGFMMLVKLYPLDADIEKWIKEWDPDAVINFIRMIHQDAISGKVSLEGLIEKLKSN